MCVLSLSAFDVTCEQIYVIIYDIEQINGRALRRTGRIENKHKTTKINCLTYGLYIVYATL